MNSTPTVRTRKLSPMELQARIYKLASHAALTRDTLSNGWVALTVYCTPKGPLHTVAPSLDAAYSNVLAKLEAK